MSVKKLLTFTAATVAALGVSVALAGGPDVSQPAPTYAGVYVEGNVGYALRDWSDIYNTTSNTNRIGGFSGGVDLGYQFNEYFSVEGGWVYLPEFTGTAAAGSTAVANGLSAGRNKISSWALYGAGKVTVPVYDNTYVFGKAGFDYNRNEDSRTAGTSNSNYWMPMFAAGAQYYFNPNLSMNVQYMFLPGNDHVNQLRSGRAFMTPEAYVFTVGLGYKFLM